MKWLFAAMKQGPRKVLDLIVQSGVKVALIGVGGNHNSFEIWCCLWEWKPPNLEFTQEAIEILQYSAKHRPGSNKSIEYQTSLIGRSHETSSGCVYWAPRTDRSPRCRLYPLLLISVMFRLFVWGTRISVLHGLDQTLRWKSIESEEDAEKRYNCCPWKDWWRQWFLLTLHEASSEAGPASSLLFELPWMMFVSRLLARFALGSAAQLKDTKPHLDVSLCQVLFMSQLVTKITWGRSVWTLVMSPRPSACYFWAQTDTENILYDFFFTHENI